MIDGFGIDVGGDPEIRSILEDVCRLTRMGFAALARVTQQQWIACQVVDTIAFGLQPGGELKVETTICSEIRESGMAVIVGDMRKDPRWFAHPTPVLYGFRSYVSLPLVLRDGLFFGTLCAIDPEPHELSSPALIGALERHAIRMAQILSNRTASGSPA